MYTNSYCSFSSGGNSLLTHIFFTHASPRGLQPARNLTSLMPGQRCLERNISNVVFGLRFISSMAITANSTERYFDGSSRFLKAIIPLPYSGANVNSCFASLNLPNQLGNSYLTLARCLSFRDG